MEGLLLRLVFGGGTALSRAHRLVRRMSEDIDLRIVADNNRSARGALRRLRTKVTEALLGVGFKFDPTDRAYRTSQNATRYTIYRLPYEPVTTGEGALRPTIQIETASWPLRRPAVELPVISFVAEALQRPPEVASMACVSILETAADKFVGLTRRAAVAPGAKCGIKPTPVGQTAYGHAMRPATSLANSGGTLEPHPLADIRPIAGIKPPHLRPDRHRHPRLPRLQGPACQVGDRHWHGRCRAGARSPPDRAFLPGSIG